MGDAFYKLPADLAQDIENHASDVRRFLSGELSPLIFKARRVPRGLYEQRRDGTYMVRIRVAAGRLGMAQIRLLADLSGDFGNGMVHITDRQDIQLHEVDIRHTPEIMRRLSEVSLATKGGGGNTVRNVTACPYAGICPDEVFDVAPFAGAVTEYLIGLPGSCHLPRKFKIAFSGCRADCALTQVNDVGFVAAVRDGKPGFSVYAGGGMGASSRIADQLEEWAPATDVIRVAEAVRRLFDRLGNRQNKHRARLRFVFNKTSPEAFRAMFHEQIDRLRAEGVPSCAISPEIHSLSDRIDGPAFVFRDGIRVLEQRQAGYLAVPIHIPMGFVSAQDLAALAEIAGQFSAEQGVRTTQSQDLVLSYVRPEHLPGLVLALRKLSFNASPAPLSRFVACAGASTCRLGLCLSRNAALACAQAIEKDGVNLAEIDPLDVRISGCPNACGQHPIGAIGLFGCAPRVQERLVPSYTVLLGARRGAGKTRLGESVGTIPARALPAFILALLRDFQSHRLDREQFADYFDRMGRAYFQQIVEFYRRIPSYAENPSFYRDWGQNEDFSLAGRGPGECGAGVFEVVSEDIATAKKALSEATVGNPRAEVLFGALLATSRALLIVRGIDSARPDEILRAFETHFLDARLVGEEFRHLLSRGRGYLEGWGDALAGRADEIRKLLERVELLFSTLDANLEFHPPEATVKPALGDNVPGALAAELDLRGVACPLNFVKAKLRLESLAVGQTLKLVLDEGEPIQNVPASFRQQGQSVIQTTSLGGGKWQVIIRKEK